ncbi:ABC transporter permease [Motilibacter aurantiacus]|uniref:ABC transporter permease n=1 Tax=Motilibacter aurantiacus TaxID=2714955 RepID=UPI00140A9678|nr:ABC transporter permease [Motilibacter aurantiacus]NHC45127.1 ABC transporter permease [Motilibacter aurantiacus]
MTQETVISPKQRIRIDWAELHRYRELFYYFAWRDLKVRYKQSVMGVGWAVFQPLATMLVFTLFFHEVAGIGSGDVPYTVFSFSGLLYWNLFSTGLLRASNSLVDNQGVITKIYFPRVIPVVSSTIVALVDFLVAFVLLVALMAYYGIAPGVAGLLFLIPSILLTMAAATGFGLLFATLNAKYRDVRQALPFFVQTALFVTPVIYPIALVPDSYQWALYLNPMTGVLDGFRAWVLGEGEVNAALIWLGVLTTAVACVAGLAYFRSREREFADYL